VTCVDKTVAILVLIIQHHQHC